MSEAAQEGQPAQDDAKGLVRLSILALVIGIPVGLLCTGFRAALLAGEDFRNGLVNGGAWAPIAGAAILVVLCGAATAIAAWLVRRHSPYASGSGIPHVELVLSGELQPAPYRLIPVKFLGGVLAIGAGLALGREGPSVQMGASFAHMIGQLCRLPIADCLVLLSAGAGAGLATAFNAPLAGAAFVLEELLRRFNTRTAIATLGASASAIAISRIFDFVGNEPEFDVVSLPYPDFGTEPFYLTLGIVMSVLGIAYNRVILEFLSATDRMTRWPVERRAFVIGAFVGLTAWFAPILVGGGDRLTQQALTSTIAPASFALILVFRFVLGPLCYAARTPGGLFAPLLVIGAQGGLILGSICLSLIPQWAPDPRTMAVVGMSAFFTAVVRSPLTGMVLTIEMTGCFPLLLPLLLANFTAMVVPTWLGEKPIYDSLRDRTK